MNYLLRATSTLFSRQKLSDKVELCQRDYVVLSRAGLLARTGIKTFVPMNNGSKLIPLLYLDGISGFLPSLSTPLWVNRMGRI
jgi:hypothetical protein